MAVTVMMTIAYKTAKRIKGLSKGLSRIST